MGGIASKLLAQNQGVKNTEAKQPTGGGMASKLLAGTPSDREQPANAEEKAYIGQKPAIGTDTARMGTNAALVAAAMKLQQDTAFEQSRGSGAAGAGTAGARLYGDRDFREGQTFVQRRDVKTQLDAAGEAYETARRRVGDFSRGGVSREQRDRAQEELAAAKAERDRLQREYEAVGGAPDGFFRRAMYTMKGGAKQSLGSNADAMGFAYQAGQGGRDAMNDDLAEQARKVYEQERRALEAQIADGRYTDAEIEEQRAIMERAKATYELYAGVGEVQRGAGEAARELAARIAASGVQDIDTAKRDLGTFGQMAVDAGASGTQMMIDMAGNALLGANPNAMLPFASRAFGGGTMEARAEGADLKHQMLYGSAMAAKEIFTEKMFNIAAPFSKAYGGGSFDNAVGNAIQNAVERFAATDVGKKAMGGLLSYGAGAGSEGLEELIGDWIEWQMPRIYGGEIDSAGEVLANSLYDFAVGTLSGMAGVDQLRYTPPSISTAVDKARAGERVSNAEAEAILGDPVAAAMLEASAGVSLTEGKTKSQQRNAVREVLAAMAERDARATPGRPAADQPAGRAISQSKGGRSGGVIISEEARAGFGKEGQQIIDVVMERSMLQGMQREQAFGAFSRAYHQGMTGQKMRAVDGLSEDGLRMAYKAGQNDAAASLDREKRAARFASVAGEDAGLVLDDYVQDLLDHAEMEQTEYDTLNRTAKRLGLRVRFVDELAHGANADITGAEVRIQKDNKNPVRFLLGHEITHRMQELAPEAYRTFRDLAMQGLGSDMTLERQAEYAADGVALDYEGAMDEVAADYAGVLIENGQLLENFIAENREDRTLLEWLRDVIRELAAKLTGRERDRAQTAEQALTRALDEAAKQAEKNAGKNKTAARKGGGARYSLRAFEDGTRFVDVQADQEQFDGLSERERGRLATKIIKNKFAGRVIGIDNKVFVNGRSAGEYGFPMKKLLPSEQEAKMRASAELDNLIDAGTNFRTEPDGRDGHVHPDMVDDFQYFDTIFKVGAEYYSGVVNVMPVKRGLLFKDITQIKNVTQDISSSYGATPKSTFLRDASMDSIRSLDENVNGNYSDAGEESKTRFSLTDSEGRKGDGARYSLNAEFNKQFDAWLASGKKELPGSGRFLVGTTSDALKSIGVSDYKIYWSGAKIAKIMDEHPNMTADVIKSVPNVLENPILVMQSQTVVNRITVFGETVDAEGKPVLAALELSPRNKRGEVQDFAVIASAYGKNGAQRLIDESEILYVDPNKNRTNNWLGLLRLQLPSRLTSYGSIGSVTYVSRDVNGKISFGEAEGKTAMQTAFERAQEKKNDTDGTSKTRFSLTDSEGRKLTKEQTEFFKDSKVRDDQGRLLIVYHGTPHGGFTVFDRKKIGTNTDDGLYGPGFYFSSYKSQSEQYATGPNGEVYAMYLNIKNPLKLADYSKKELSELLDMEERDIVESRGIPRPTYSMARTFKSRVLNAGFDGIIVDYGTNDEMIAFSPEQIKRVDNTSPTDDPDIRFSMTGAREFADQVLALQQNRGNKTDAEVRKEIIQLAEEFREKLGRGDEQGLTDRAAVRKTGRKLIKEFGADLKPGEITDDLQTLYDYMAGGEHGNGEISYGRARELAETAARKLVDSATAVDDTLYREFEDLRGYLRSQKIVVPEETVREIGDFDAYRKSTMGKLVLGTKGHANLDMVYSELCEMYPAWFDGEALAGADQLDQIVSAAEAIYRRTEYNPFEGADMEHVVQSAAQEIMETFYDLPQAKTRQSQRMNERERAVLRREVSEQLNRQREYNDREMEKVRQKHQETITQLETSNLRKRIARNANRMGQMLLKPTDKKHVPEHLRGAAATLVEAINLESAYVWSYDEDTGKAKLVLEKNAPEGVKTKRTEAFLQLRTQYATILKEIKDGDSDFMGVIDPQLAEYIDEAIELRDKRLGEMDRAELDVIWKALRAVEHSITTADKVLSEAKFNRVEDWVLALSADTADRKGKRARLKTHPSLDLETPYTFFSHMGESGTAIYKMLRGAQDKQQMMVEEVAGAVNEIVTPEQVKALQEERHEFQTERGDKLTLTTAHVMELYELTKRKQAHDHLMEGGIVQPEINKDIRRGTEPIKLSMEDLQQIAGVLTEEQTELADRMQQLCVTVLARWGNEASVQAYGYKKFNDKNYWPIRSAREGLYQTVEKGGDQPRQIKNIGMGKATTPHANTPMELSGLFTTFARHAADMSDYAAWLCPMEDCTRLYNYKFRDEEGTTTGKSFKSMLERAAGEQAQAYWSNLMEDIQNGISAKSDSMSWGTMGKLVGSFKGAAVGGNMRVVIQQPTAFFRAAVVLNPADMAAGITGGVAKVAGEDGKALSGWEKALKYAPIAVRKDRGGFDISSPRMMTEILYDERTRLRRFNDALSAAAGKADAVTWGKLWNACEHAVQRERAELEAGNEEFFRAVSEKFSDVIDQTQVVDGVLQRSNAMRSSNAVMQQATSFMGEPIMSLNLMMRAWDAWRYEKSPERRSKALKTMGRAASALVVTNLVNAVAQSLVDAIRGDDPDKDYWERFMDAFTGLDGDEESVWDKFWSVAFDGNAGQNNNVLTMIPFVKDVVSLIEGYDVARTEMEVISDVVTAAKGVVQNIGGDGKRTRKYAINTLVRSAAKMFGIPVQNLERDAWGILRTFAVETDSIPLQYEMEKAVYNLSYAGNKGRFLDVMFRALEQEDYETYDHIRSDLMQAGVVDGKAIDSGMWSRLEKKRETDPTYLLPERAAELIGWRPARGSGREGQTERFNEGNLNADQYKSFAEERAELYRGYTSRLDSNRYFAELDDETREKVYDMAAKLAGNQALENNADGQFEMDTAWMQWAAGGVASGVDETEAILFKAAYDLSTGKDESGKTVAGLKKERTLETAEQWMPWLTDAELEYLMSQFWK